MILRSCSHALLLAGIVATPAFAQAGASRAPARALSIGVGGLAEYPRPFGDGCNQSAAVAPTATLRQRMGRFFAAEGSIAAHLPITLVHVSDCRDLLFAPGATYSIREFEGANQGSGVIPEARIVFSPEVEGAAILRAFAGAGWYVGRSAPVLSAGAGFHAPTRWGGLTFDVERRFARLPYDLVQLTVTDTGLDRTTVGEGRQEFRSWQLRIAFDVWVSGADRRPH
jgi:hypothetical protein